MKMRIITATALTALAISGAYAAPSQVANLSVRVDGGTEVIGFESPAQITDANATAIANGTLTQSIPSVQIYTNNDPGGLTITATSQNVDPNNGNNPAIMQNGNYIPIALSFTPCGGGTPIELLSRTNGSAANATSVNTNLAANWSANACATTPGSATITYGGDSVEPVASATPYTGALTIAVASN